MTMFKKFLPVIGEFYDMSNYLPKIIFMQDYQPKLDTSNFSNRGSGNLTVLHGYIALYCGSFTCGLGVWNITVVVVFLATGSGSVTKI